MLGGSDRFMVEEMEAMANQAFIQQSTMPKMGDWNKLEEMGAR